MSSLEDTNTNTNVKLNKAKKDKNDEFYTQLSDIEKEIETYLFFTPDLFRDKTVLLPCDDPNWSNFIRYFIQNFKRLGLKRLISTCITNEPLGKGKLLIVNRDYDSNNNLMKPNMQLSGVVSIDDIINDNLSSKIELQELSYQYLLGDGDFRSQEVTDFATQSDIIITNPPFSLFREFIDWVIKTGKLFSIIGNMNAITCKEIFPLIKDNKVWLGASISCGDREFRVPDDYEIRTQNSRVDEKGRRYIRVSGVRWFTNIDYGRKQRFIELKTMDENKRFNKRVKSDCYKPYSNYNAIEISSASAIPIDFEGYMGVPISFLDKYNPNQFKIVGLMENWDKSPEMERLRTDLKNRNRGIVVGDNKRKYARIIIKRIGNADN